ncbi:TIM-barrel domain-containing protein [Paraferrimonas haliotis]|uniref:Alpha-glucosidase n=1 Tax=Paraferrimonas haliotis TaxID=2013866 RepID=A0AA37WWD7_9GAMM|nr:TIM-barrel domain-containing protein [Paraferrimonas haliotis]GLS83418.1 alpha-glucosidase [Paraferrimonas haliotis]
MRQWIFAFVCLVGSGSALATQVVSHKLVDEQLLIETDNGPVLVSGYGNGAMAVHYQPKGVKQLPSFAIDEQAPIVQGELSDDGDVLHYRLAEIRAEIQKSPLQFRFYQNDKLLVAEEAGLVSHDSVRGFRFALNDEEKLIGGGQRVVGMDRRGMRLPLYNKASYGYTTHAEQMYFGLSAVMSTNKYALVFDNSASGWMDLGKTEANILQFEAKGGRTAYLVAAGHNYPSLIENLTEATGRQPLPPRWALGNYASRFGYRSEQQARETVAKFIEEDFPLDAIVLDLYWFGADIKGHMGNLAWDRKAWPNPRKMIRDFSDLGINTVLITEPFVLTSSKRWQQAVDAKALAHDFAGKPKTFDFYFGNTGLIDVFSQSGQEWFWGIYQELLKDGVAGWWGDLGEPEVHPHDAIHALGSADEIHNAYGHQWAKLVFEGLQQAQPDKRPMIMMRSGFIGSQRYGMIPWTGDVSRSWDGLKPQVELALQMGLLGLGYTHSDLGGFAGGEQFDAEMYTRWMQYGVFQPVYRPHAQDNIAPEPVFHDQQTKDIVRRYVNLRYQLMPYLYTLAYENSTSGMPLMRPLMFSDETDLSLVDNKDAYFWGDAFLVAPVVEAGAKSVAIDLPKGVWFDFFTNVRFNGGQAIDMPVSIDTIPVLVKAGSFIPMVAVQHNTKDYTSANLELHYYHDDSVRKAYDFMYEDDGVNPKAIAQGQYQLLEFKADYAHQLLTLHLHQNGDYMGAPKSRQVTVTIHNWNKQQAQVTLSGKTLDSRIEQGKLMFTLPWNQAEQVISIR